MNNLDRLASICKRIGLPEDKFKIEKSWGMHLGRRKPTYRVWINNSALKSNAPFILRDLKSDGTHDWVCVLLGSFAFSEKTNWMKVKTADSRSFIDCSSSGFQGVADEMLTEYLNNFVKISSCR